MNNSTIPQLEQLKINRAIRYKRQSVSALYAREYTQHSVSRCMTAIKSDVKIKYSDKLHHAFYSGLITCDSVWDCPVCSSRIRAGRADEIREGVTNWLNSGHAVVMITYTIRHKYNDKLNDLAKKLTDGIRFIHSGRPWQRVENSFGIKGSINGVDIKFNLKNGWHIHKHQIVFLESADINKDDLQHFMFKRYKNYLDTVGIDVIEGIGLLISDITTDPGKLPEYLTKWDTANEITSDLKDGEGINVFELLDNPDLKDKWLEYSISMFGKRFITWSKGLRLLLGLGAEKTDSELNEQDKEVDDISREFPILDSEWHVIVKKHLRADVLDKFESMELHYFLNWFSDNVTGFISSS